MFETIIQFDLLIFEFINNQIQNPIFDFFLSSIRNKYIWGPLYVFILSFLILNFGKKGFFAVLLIFATVGVSDFVSSSIVKPSIKRDRPCNDFLVKEKTRLLVKCGRGYSFTSSHATNHFALAIIIGLLAYRRKRAILIYLLIWASLISFAQVYVGVHYPFDVLVGSLLGTLIALFIGFIFIPKIDI